MKWFSILICESVATKIKILPPTTAAVTVATTKTTARTVTINHFTVLNIMKMEAHHFAMKTREKLTIQRFVYYFSDFLLLLMLCCCHCWCCHFSGNLLLALHMLLSYFWIKSRFLKPILCRVHTHTHTKIHKKHACLNAIVFMQSIHSPYSEFFSHEFIQMANKRAFSPQNFLAILANGKERNKKGNGNTCGK